MNISTCFFSFGQAKVRANALGKRQGKGIVAEGSVFFAERSLGVWVNTHPTATVRARAIRYSPFGVVGLLRIAGGV
ncbi:MAG: hypothetical protein E7367_05485 [Clostridiales bacterium]|nr:hypothetical protein [Clostridiales bacterium]